MTGISTQFLIPDQEICANSAPLRFYREITEPITLLQLSGQQHGMVVLIGTSHLPEQETGIRAPTNFLSLSLLTLLLPLTFSLSESLFSLMLLVSWSGRFLRERGNQSGEESSGLYLYLIN